MKNNVTKVVLFFVAATLLVGYVFGLAFADVFDWLAIVDRPVLGERFTLSTLSGMSLGVLLGIVLGLVYKPSRKYIEDVISEMDKVAWPTWTETRTGTVTVIITCCIAAAILGVFDGVFGWLSHNNLFLR